MSGCRGCGNEYEECTCASDARDATLERIALALEGLQALAGTVVARYDPPPEPRPAPCPYEWAGPCPGRPEGHQCCGFEGHGVRHECRWCDGARAPVADPTPTPGVPDRPAAGYRYVPEMVARDSIPGFMPGMGDIKAPTPPPECGITWDSAMLNGTRQGHTCGLPSGHEGKHRCRGCPVHVDVVAPPAAATPEPAPKPTLSDDPARCPAATRCMKERGHAGIHVFDPLDCYSTWRPIETAPRDGDKVFLLLRTGDAHCGWYNSAAEAWGNRERMWRNDAITHWCPLPVKP